MNLYNTVKELVSAISFEDSYVSAYRLGYKSFNGNESYNFSSISKKGFAAGWRDASEDINSIGMNDMISRIDTDKEYYYRGDRITVVELRPADGFDLPAMVLIRYQGGNLSNVRAAKFRELATKAF